MANLANRLSQANSSCEIATIMRDVEVTAKDFPDRAVQFGKYLIPLFSSPFSSIRKSAYNSAISIVNINPVAADQLLPAYQAALFSSSREVARHALSFLPHFVAVALEQSDSLIKCALQASQRQPGPTDAHVYIGQAMDVVKKMGVPK